MDSVAQLGGTMAGGMPDCMSCRFRLCTHAGQAGGARCPSIKILARGDRLDIDQPNCTRFWTLLSGTAATCTALPDGRRQIIGIETAGDIICAMAFVRGSENWLEALDECRVCEVDLSGSDCPVHADPQFALMMFTHTHARLQSAIIQLVALGRLDGMERMCLFLSNMARSEAGEPGEPVRLSLPLSREDIADYLGLNSETVSRIISRIRKAKLIVSLSRSEFLIPDIAALERRVPLSAQGLLRHAELRLEPT